MREKGNCWKSPRALLYSFRMHFPADWLSCPRSPSFFPLLPPRLPCKVNPAPSPEAEVAASGMESIEELALGPCVASQYLRPFRLRYRQNGISKLWDFMRTHDSVSILIFNISRQCFVVVKQFRPAVYMCEMEQQSPQYFENKPEESWCPLSDCLPASKGITYELCAGIVDQPDLSLEEIACKEVLEECGYEVPVTSLKRITSYRSGVGVTGSKQTLFYAQVTDDMKSSEGGGQPEEGELIEVVEIPVQDSMKFAFDETFPKTMGVIFSFMWFQTNIAPKLLEE